LIVLVGLLGCLDLGFGTSFALVERCAPTVTTLRPANGDTEIPLDARLLGVLDQSGDGCDDASVEFVLSLDGEELQAAGGKTQPAAGVVELEPDEAFEPERTYDLWLEDFFTGLEFDISFTSGTELAAVYDQPPVVTIDELVFVDGERGSDEFLWTAVLTVDHEPSDRDLSLIHLSGGESLVDTLGAVFANSDGVRTVELPFWTAEVDGEVCFRAIQEVEAGRGGDASDAVCETLPEVSLSCSSTGSGSSAVALLLLPLLFSRRRRC